MRYKSSAGWRAMVGLGVVTIVTAGAVATGIAAPSTNEVTLMHSQASPDSKNLAANTDAAVETKALKGQTPTMGSPNLRCSSGKATDC